MKTEAQIREELRLIRERMEQAYRDENNDDESDHWFLYGAQQALGWALGETRQPSEFIKLVDVLAEMFPDAINP